MKKKVMALCCVLVLAISAPAVAQPNCTGALDDRPSSCFNAGPSDVGFHGQK